jgi:hypothetical protein
MGDLGFGAVIAKVEEYFGRHITRVVLALVLGFIVVGAVSGIWTLGIAPIVAYFARAPSVWSVVANAVGLGITFGTAMAGASLILDAYRRRLATDELERSVPAARELLERVEASSAEVSAHRAEVLDVMAQARATADRGEALVALSSMALEELVESGLKSGRITAEQGAEIRALAAEVRATPSDGASEVMPDRDAGPFD